MWEVVKQEKKKFLEEKSAPISFPILFLRHLYNAGHELVWEKYWDWDLLDVISKQLSQFHPFYEKNLFDELIKYEKDNIEVLKSSPLLTSIIIRKYSENKSDWMRCVDHIESLESKEISYEAFDVQCLATMMKTRIRVYFPDYSSDMQFGEKIFNPDECLYEIAIVMDYSRFPKFTYPTFPVVQGGKNPYEMMDVGSATHLVCREKK